MTMKNNVIKLKMPHRELIWEIPVNTLGFLTSGGIPFLRICEQGLVDVRQNKFVDLIVE